MRVVFCCIDDFRGAPGARQILLLAQALERAGHVCLVLVNGDPGTVSSVAGGAGGVAVERYRFVGPVLDRRTRELARAFQPDVVHCYEPRTAPLAAALELSRRNGAPLCVRFADDDELLFREAGGSGLRRLIGRPALIAAGTVQPPLWPYKHPLHYRRMLRAASGYDAITPALAAEITRRYGVRCEAILPAVPDPGGALRRDDTVRQRLGIPPDGPLILYTGSVFRSHFADYELLLRAFARVVTERPDARLVHTGRLADRYGERELRRIAAAGADRLHLLGFLERVTDLEALMHAGAVLAQPGAPTEFNRLRLPAKLHDYLMTGRPVVTFAAGFGELLRDRRDAVLTFTAEPAELAAALLWVIAEPERAATIGAQGRRRALELFDPAVIGARTAAYYERVRAT